MVPAPTLTPVAQRGVAHVGEVRHLGAATDARLLQLDEVADLGARPRRGTAAAGGRTDPAGRRPPPSSPRARNRAGASHGRRRGVAHAGSPCRPRTRRRWSVASLEDHPRVEHACRRPIVDGVVHVGGGRIERRSRPLAISRSRMRRRMTAPSSASCLRSLMPRHSHGIGHGHRLDVRALPLQDARSRR